MSSLGSVYSNIGFALRLHSDALSRLQEQASSGTRINRASDAPADAYRVMVLVSEKRSLANYMDNISQGIDALEAGLTAVRSLTSTVTQAKVSLTQIVSGVYDENSRETTASQINDMLEQIVSLANTRHLNEYIFVGIRIIFFNIFFIPFSDGVDFHPPTFRIKWSGFIPVFIRMGIICSEMGKI